MRFWLAILFFFAPFGSLADTKILVSATRNESSVSDLPFSADYLSGDAWRQSGGKPESALSPLPGLSFSNSGGLGQSRFLSIRGAKAEHTLVLIDGIPVNDPLSPSRSFDFGQIPVEEIDHVEVIKGPASVIYGSDAVGGVVQLFTKQDKRSHVSLEGGSYSSFNYRFSTQGFHAGYSGSKGYSSADAREGNAEPDGYRQWNLGGAQEFKASEKFLMRLNAHYQDSSTDTDRNGGAGGDSLNTTSKHSQFLFREENVFPFSERAQLNVAGSYNSHHREDNTNGSDFYKADRWKAESLFCSNELIEGHNLLLGLEAGEESGRSSQITEGLRRFRQGGFFVQDEFKHDALHGALGWRFDLHSEHEKAQTYRIGLGYWLLPEVLRLKGSIGTGFKAPSLYQTYSSYGSPQLKPERSLGGDLGIEVNQPDWNSGISFFANTFRDQIEFNLLSNHFFNQSRANTYGLEWGSEWRFGLFSAANAFTLLQARNPEDGMLLLRRPKLSNNLELRYNQKRKIGGSLSLRYVGVREDTHPVLLTRQSMPAFLTMGAHFFHRLGEGLRFTSRAENLLNRQYQETSGYGVAGLSGYAGIEADL